MAIGNFVGEKKKVHTRRAARSSSLYVDENDKFYCAAVFGKLRFIFYSKFQSIIGNGGILHILILQNILYKKILFLET